MPIIDPSATADGTDLFQVQLYKFRLCEELLPITYKPEPDGRKLEVFVL